MSLILLFLFYEQMILYNLLFLISYGSSAHRDGPFERKLLLNMVVLCRSDLGSYIFLVLYVLTSLFVWKMLVRGQVIYFSLTYIQIDLVLMQLNQIFLKYPIP